MGFKGCRCALCRRFDAGCVRALRVLSPFFRVSRKRLIHVTRDSLAELVLVSARGSMLLEPGGGFAGQRQDRRTLTSTTPVTGPGGPNCNGLARVHHCRHHCAGRGSAIVSVSDQPLEVINYNDAFWRVTAELAPPAQCAWRRPDPLFPRCRVVIYETTFWSRSGRRCGL